LKGMKVNEEWHADNAMPKNPTRVQRVRWHAEHAKMCGCRPVPMSIEAEVRAKMKVVHRA
jgi:hypothetical protein